MASDPRWEDGKMKATNLLGVDEDLVGVRGLVVGLVNAEEEEEGRERNRGGKEVSTRRRRRRWEMAGDGRSNSHFGDGGGHSGGVRRDESGLGEWDGDLVGLKRFVGDGC